MAAIVWEESLTTGIDAIDNQHKEMFRQANILFETLSKIPDKKKLKESMQFLVEYVEKHFEAEKKVMKSFDYPGRMAHAFEHDQLTKSLHELVEEFINGNDMMIPSRLGGLVSQWMTQHIKKSDMEFIQFIRSKVRREDFKNLEV